mmetsp:Transcript_79958/g.244464  ORF Transcript_79958/g.244464 Transcript_79958/m.244464 type:complete len:311 (+) Transcript_79958:2453-3385(+)
MPRGEAANTSSVMKYTHSGMKRRLPDSPHTSKYATISASCLLRTPASHLGPHTEGGKCSHAAPAKGCMDPSSTRPPESHRRSLAFQYENPASKLLCKSLSASASKYSSLNVPPNSKHLSATSAQCDRQRDRRCSCWFLALSIWKSNLFASSSNKSAAEAANPLACGKSRRQEPCIQALRSDSPSASVLPEPFSGDADLFSTRSPEPWLQRDEKRGLFGGALDVSSLPWRRRSSRRSRLLSDVLSEPRMRSQKLSRPEPQQNRLKMRTRTPMGVRRMMLCLNQLVSRQYGAWVSTQHSTPSVISVPHALMA